MPGSWWEIQGSIEKKGLGTNSEYKGRKGAGLHSWQRLLAVVPTNYEFETEPQGFRGAEMID